MEKNIDLENCLNSLMSESLPLKSTLDFIYFNVFIRQNCKICQNYFIADIRSDERSQKILQTGQQENQGIPSGEDHDGPGPRLSHPQHAASNPRAYRSKWDFSLLSTYFLLILAGHSDNHD